MNAARIQSLKPLLASFLKRFDGCFVSAGTRGHLSSYVQGQLSDLPRKNSEPIADARDLPPRTLQEFLSLLKWDHALLKTRLQQLVATEHADPQRCSSRIHCSNGGSPIIFLRHQIPGVANLWSAQRTLRIGCNLVRSRVLGNAVTLRRCP